METAVLVAPRIRTCLKSPFGMAPSRGPASESRAARTGVGEVKTHGESS